MRLETALRGINTGIVRPSLLESIKVDAYGELVPLAHVATVTGASGAARSLRVMPFDSSLIGKTVQAIQAANIGLNPQPAGTTVLVSVPMPDEDQRKRLVARAKELAEQQRVAVRNIRRDARNEDKRTGASRADEIETMTRQKISQIDVALKGKIDDINWSDPRWNRQ